MKIFAHRGLSSVYPENTLLAFSKAMEYNIDGIETDVQMTKDGELVIFHDERINRTTNGSGFIKDFTLEELKKFNANNKMDYNVEIPTLDEFLALVEGSGLIINLELKTSIFEYEGIEEKTLELIKKHNLEDNIIVSSFNHQSLLRMKKLAPNIKCGVLTGDVLIDGEKYCKDHGFEAFHPMFVYCTKERVELAHELGIAMNVWTVDWEEQFEMLKDIGVDVIMTNRCHEFCEKK